MSAFRVVEDEHGQAKKQFECRSVLDWCCQFAKPGKWGDVRGREVWTKLDDNGGICVALRVELFGQIRISHFAGMSQNKFSRLAEMYEVGKRGKAGGTRVVILNPLFVQEYLHGRRAGIANSADDEDGPRAHTRERSDELSPTDDENDETTGS